MPRNSLPYEYTNNASVSTRNFTQSTVPYERACALVNSLHTPKRENWSVTYDLGNLKYNPATRSSVNRATHPCQYDHVITLQASHVSATRGHCSHGSKWEEL